jgi:putative membrane protein
VLSISLVFRVNEAYARWWEARILWGQLVNASRGLARQATTLIVSNGDGEGSQRVETIRRELVYRQIAFVNALRLSLRREDDLDELAPLLAPSEFEGLEAAANRPTQLLQCQGRAIAAARASGNLTEFGELMFDRTLNALHEVQGGCERIKNTAFPDKVAFATQVIAWSMAGLTAVAIAHPENGFDLIDTIVLPFMMLGFVVTERIGAELRNPFENAPNDTPMTALCRTIEIDLRQNLGEQDIPPPIEPVRGVLM